MFNMDEYRTTWNTCQAAEPVKLIHYQPSIGAWNWMCRQEGTSSNALTEDAVYPASICEGGMVEAAHPDAFSTEQAFP